MEAPEALTETLPLSPLLEAVRTPISEANPVGDDVKYEDSFQQLKTEVDKVQSANADADFEQIVALGTQILGAQSKDLTVAAYLGFGLLQTSGLAGIAEGATTVQLLCEHYWDDMYPPVRRMVARKNALQLLIDRTTEALDTVKPGANDGPVIQRALDSYAVLQTLAMEKMGEDAPVISKVTRALETKLRAVPKPKEKAVGENKAGGAAPAPSGGGEAVATSPDAFQSPNEAERATMAAATYLRSEAKTSPVPYLVTRALRWGPLVAPPPATDGKTLVPPFVEQRKTYLEGLLAGGQFAELLDGAEESFADQPFWLDLQRYIVTACEALGGPFAPVRDALIGSLAGLVQRFPDLPVLTFANEVPFADTATQTWIDLRVRSAIGLGSEGPTPADEGSPLDTAYAEAHEQLAGGDLDAAIATLAETSDAAGRDRFRRRLYLASLCVRGGRPAVACALLERLAAEATAHDLGAWEPALAVDVWTLLHGCYGALQRGATATEKERLSQAAARAFEHVAALDPAAALALAGAGA